MAQCQVAGCDNPVKSGEVCESCGEKGVVSVEFLTDTATQYISEGLDRERAIAKACNDALERMEERDNAE